jgi:hypothetical protein
VQSRIFVGVEGRYSEEFHDLINFILVCMEETIAE